MKLKSNEQNIFFTSDTHYSHKNICKGVTNWKYDGNNCRDFGTIEEMDKAIVEGINSTVREEDILFHLGDWSFGGIEKIWELRKQINCKNVHLIFGNHDHHIVKNKLLPNCVYDLVLRDINDPNKDEAIYKDGNGTLEPFHKVYSQNIFSSVQHYLEIEIDKMLVMLFHRPIDDFHNNERTNTIHLHGHSHGNSSIKNNRLDVGIDVAYKYYGKYRPFSWEEVLNRNEVLPKYNYFLI